MSHVTWSFEHFLPSIRSVGHGQGPGGGGGHGHTPSVVRRHDVSGHHDDAHDDSGVIPPPPSFHDSGISSLSFLHDSLRRRRLRCRCNQQITTTTMRFAFSPLRSSGSITDAIGPIGLTQRGLCWVDSIIGYQRCVAVTSKPQCSHLR